MKLSQSYNSNHDFYGLILLTQVIFESFFIIEFLFLFYLLILG